MRKQKGRIVAGIVATAGVLLSGCSGSSGSKPSSDIREVDVATNVVNTTTNADTAAVLVNGGGSDVAVPYGLASSYLFVQAGSIGFQGTTTMTLPTITQTLAGATTPTTTTVPPTTSSDSLADGSFYTAYLVGRPDVPNPTNPNLSDLDPRYLKVVVLQDNQALPPTGQATVRLLNGACDAGNIDVFINAGAAPTFAGVPYTVQTTPATPDQFLTAGAVTVTVKATGSGTVLVPATPITLVAGNRYTLIVNEPTAITQAGVVPPTPPATATTYSVVLVHDN
jgi:hypothetical protein